MPDEETAGAWRGHELIDRDGEKIGKIDEIYMDRHSGEPAWVTVKSGLLSKHVTVVPIGDSMSEGEIVRVPYDKEHVLSSPEIDPDSELSESDEGALYDHYGVERQERGGEHQERGAEHEDRGAEHEDRGAEHPDQGAEHQDPGTERQDRSAQEHSDPEHEPSG